VEGGKRQDGKRAVDRGDHSSSMPSPRRCCSAAKLLIGKCEGHAPLWLSVRNRSGRPLTAAFSPAPQLQYPLAHVQGLRHPECILDLVRRAPSSLHRLRVPCWLEPLQWCCVRACVSLPETSFFFLFFHLFMRYRLFDELPFFSQRASLFSFVHEILLLWVCVHECLHVSFALQPWGGR